MQMWGIMKLKKSIMLLVLSAIFVAASVAVLPLSSGIRAEESYVYKEVTDFESLESKTEIVLTHTDGDKRYVLTAETAGEYVVPKEYNETADFTEKMVWLYGNYDNDKFTLKSKAFPEYYLTKLKIQKSGIGDYGEVVFSDGQLFNKTGLIDNHLSYVDDAGGGVYNGFNTTKYTVAGDNDISFCILKREKTQKQTYTASFYDEDGTTVLSSQTVEEGTSITIPECSAVKEGYRFIGWIAGDQTYYAGDSYTVTENVTFTAVWEKIPPKTFTWTYMDGDEVLLTLPVTEGETYELKDYGELAPDSLQEGDSFLGWYCKETELKSPVCATADMTIQAKISVTITFDLAGGEWTENSAYKAIKGKSFSLPQVSPNKEGTKYEFLGFFLNGKEIKDSFKPETSVTLTAKWNQVLFTVNFVSDGQVISSQTVATADQLDLDSLKPEKGDMKFLYWADENGEEVYFETLTLSEDRTFTAIFAFEVTFLTRDGETDHTVMCGEDEKIDFPEITLGEKESFVGWIDVKNEKIYSGKNRFAVTENIKFRAAIVEMETVGEAYLRVGSGLADSGIQFKTLISGSDWLTVSPYVTAGTLITQADCLAENDFTLDCLTEGETVLNIVSTKNTFSGEYKRVSASIVNLKEYNYGKKFLARGYLKAEYADIGSGYVYAHYDKTFSVSAKELAEEVLGGNWTLTDVQKSILRAYAGQE